MRTVAEHLPFTFASIGVGLYFIDRFGYRWGKVTERNARRGRQYCRIAKFSFAAVYSPGMSSWREAYLPTFTTRG